MGTVQEESILMASPISPSTIPPMSGTVHVEAMPDSGHEDAAWVEQLCRKAQCSFVKGIVASCDLTQDMVELETNLEQIMQASPKKLKGIRWILDCVGPYQKGGTTATHVATFAS